MVLLIGGSGLLLLNDRDVGPLANGLCCSHSADGMVGSHSLAVGSHGTTVC